MRQYDAMDVVQALRTACYEEGSQGAFARKYGISRAHITNVLNGHNSIGMAIPLALGYKVKLVYERAD